MQDGHWEIQSGIQKKLEELLPHKARDPGSILTSGTVSVEFTHSPCDSLGYFLPPASPHIPKTCGSVSSSVAASCPLCVGEWAREWNNRELVRASDWRLTWTWWAEGSVSTLYLSMNQFLYKL